MYDYMIKPSVDKIFFKLAKKNHKQLMIIYNKIEEIIENPLHYKNLRKPLQYLRRVHIDKSYVLLFSIDETKKMVVIEYYEHHDKIYK